MTFTPGTDERVEYVAEIIRDMWPHRMSLAAAKAIDKVYTLWIRQNTHMEYRVVIDRPRGLRRVAETGSLRAARQIQQSQIDMDYDARIEQRFVSSWATR